MKPLSSLQHTEATRISGVLFDLDDTFLDDGKLTETAYGALHRLARAGLRLVAVTGRPAGWGEVMARQRPVDGVVTENGALALYRDGGRVARWERADEATRRARRIRIARRARRVCRARLAAAVGRRDGVGRIARRRRPAVAGRSSPAAAGATAPHGHGEEHDDEHRTAADDRPLPGQDRGER